MLFNTEIPCPTTCPPKNWVNDFIELESSAIRILEVFFQYVPAGPGMGSAIIPRFYPLPWDIKLCSQSAKARQNGKEDEFFLPSYPRGPLSLPLRSV